jgi:sugar O-acyltransferase (sialic acid O-acetyltransferase NeuD family)
MKKEKKLVIVGAGEFAEIAYEYFTHDSPYEVVAFSVNKAFIKENTLFGLPVVPFEELEKHYSPQEHSAFVAVTFTQLNRVRTKLYTETKEKRFPIASYVSSKAFVWHNAKIGENCFIFENNVIQYHVKIGNNVIMWSGNHVGHRSTIADNTFLSSHVVVSGYCNIGKNCFFGVNSTLGDTLNVGDDCVIGAGAVLVRPAEDNKIYIGNPAKVLPMGSREKFKVD